MWVLKRVLRVKERNVKGCNYCVLSKICCKVENVFVLLMIYIPLLFPVIMSLWFTFGPLNWVSILPYSLFFYFYGTFLCFSKCIVNLLGLLFFEASNKYHDFGLHLTPSSSIFTFVERKIALELEEWGFTCICFVENNEKLFLEVKENLKERKKIFFFLLSFGKGKDR